MLYNGEEGKIQSTNLYNLYDLEEELKRPYVVLRKL